MSQAGPAAGIRPSSGAGDSRRHDHDRNAGNGGCTGSRGNRGCTVGTVTDGAVVAVRATGQGGQSVAPAGRIAVPRPGVEPGTRPSRGRVMSGFTIEASSGDGRNRTGPGCVRNTLAAVAHAPPQYSRQDSNLRMPPRHGGAVAAGPRECQSSRPDLNRRPPPCDGGGHSGLPHGTVSALDGSRTRLTCSTNRPPRRRRPRACQRVSGGSRTRLSTVAWWCLDCSATDTSQQGRTESNHVRRLWRPTAHPGARPCNCPGRNRTCIPPVNSGPHHRCATGHRQFRGLGSNQHLRVQSPPPYRLGDPGIGQLPERESNPHARAGPQFLRLVRLPVTPPGSILGGIRTRDLRLERPAATPQAHEDNHPFFCSRGL